MSSATEVSLSEGRVIRVVGPARVEVLSGAVLAVGSRYPAGSSFVVHRLRSYGIKALSPAKLRLTLGDGSRVEECGEGEEVVDDWLSASEYIVRRCLERRQCSVLVVGPPESGKTTFTAFLANRLREAGLRVGVVEGDVGQEDVLIPTTIALAEVSRPVIWLRELEPVSLRFVGCTSPQYCYSESIMALRELVDEAARAGFDAVVLNTDGWVGSPSGIEHKLAIARWVRPDVVVVTGEDVYECLSRSIGGQAEVVRIRRPAIVRERSREERRELRTQAYRKYFSRGRIRRVKLGGVALFGACFLSGRPVSRDELAGALGLSDSELERVLYSSRVGDTLYVVASGELSIPRASPAESGRIVVLSPDDIKGALVGLLGDGMREAGVGIIWSAEFESRELSILTPWEGEIRGIVVGRVRLSENFEEVGRVVRCTP